MMESFIYGSTPCPRINEDKGVGQSDALPLSRPTHGTRKPAVVERPSAASRRAAGESLRGQGPPLD